MAGRRPGCMMSYCLNLSCQHPENPDDANFCQSCGRPLLLRSRYRAVRPLGQGGFGRTILAVDTDKPSQPLCVIKQFFPRSPNPENSQKAITFFRQEAEQLESLGHHPQIPDLLAYFVIADQHYLVQEFIEGETLASLVATGQPFDQPRILNLLNALLPVLQFIHDHQVIHRDIKPENIIWRSSTDSYVLVDFGAAKHATPLALAQTGTVIGSAAYAAPEQVGGKATFASDLYSLGVTCLHLLTLIEPFDLFSFADDRWVWRDYLQHPIDPALGRILDKLVARPLRLRYSSASEVLRHLHLLTPPAPATTSPLPLTPPSLPEPLSPKPVLNRPMPSPPKAQPSTPQPAFRPLSQWFAPPPPAQPHRPAPPPTLTRPESRSPSLPNRPGTPSPSLPLAIDDDLTDDLASAVGVDYRSLQALLAAGDWPAADQETSRLMLRAMHQEAAGWLSFDHLATFPCIDLQTIDRLWVKYSQGHFGFSVQQQIWQHISNPQQSQSQQRSPTMTEYWCDFGVAIGWLQRVEKRIGEALRGDIHEYHWLSRDEVIATVQLIPADELLVRVPVGCLPFFCSLYTGTSRGGRILLERIATCIG